jgi:hypothetical protein
MKIFGFEACTKQALHAFSALLQEHIALGPNQNMCEHAQEVRYAPLDRQPDWRSPGSN